MQLRLVYWFKTSLGIYISYQSCHVQSVGRAEHNGNFELSLHSHAQRLAGSRWSIKECKNKLLSWGG